MVLESEGVRSVFGAPLVPHVTQEVQCQRVTVMVSEDGNGRL
jgi:hypothetical protein